MSAIAWSTIEAALQAWVVAASGLADTKVIWADRGAPPSLPYCSMSIEDIGGVGQDWQIYDDAPNPVPGAELRVRARGHRVATLHLQMFEATGSGNAAMQILSDVVASIPLYQYAIDVAGVGIGDIEPVRKVRGNRGSILEPRAVTNVTLHLGSELEARETYIERIQLTATIKNDSGTTLGAVETWVPSPPV